MVNAPLLIGPHSTITIHYRMAMEDGTEADSTFDDDPVTFQLGQGMLLPNLEKLLLGLQAGEHRTFELSPEEGFGYVDSENFHYVARSEFPDEIELEPGKVIGFDTPSGEELPGLVMTVDDEQVLINFNHPLAGHDLTFEVQVVAIEAN